ncbi:hypothetical protein ACC708_37390, partial [Rhizobium ruizarguesonis]
QIDAARELGYDLVTEQGRATVPGQSVPKLDKGRDRSSAVDEASPRFHAHIASLPSNLMEGIQRAVGYWVVGKSSES